MASLLAQLERSVGRIDWRDEEASAEAADLLRSVGPERLRRIARYGLAGVWDRDQTSFRRDGFSRSIRQTPTHLKVLLAGDHVQPEGSKLWTHFWGVTAQVDPAVCPVFAEVHHKHRYPAAAEVIAEDEEYEASEVRYQDGHGVVVSEKRLWLPDIEVWQNKDLRTYRTGDALGMTDLDVHSIRLRSAASRPVSMFVQGPTTYHTSYAYDEETGAVDAGFPDLPQAFSETLRKLQKAD